MYPPGSPENSFSNALIIKRFQKRTQPVTPKLSPRKGRTSLPRFRTTRLRTPKLPVQVYPFIYQLPHYI